MTIGWTDAESVSQHTDVAWQAESCGSTHHLGSPGRSLHVVTGTVEFAGGRVRAAIATAGAGGAKLTEQAEQVGDVSVAVTVDVRGTVGAAEAGEELVANMALSRGFCARTRADRISKMQQ